MGKIRRKRNRNRKIFELKAYLSKYKGLFKYYVINLVFFSELISSPSESRGPDL